MHKYAVQIENDHNQLMMSQRKRLLNWRSSLQQYKNLFCILNEMCYSM